MSDSNEEKQGKVYARFVTEMKVRPDDIDLFQHVHSSRYMDYLLAARFDQMERCYKMPMSEYLERNMGWYQTSITMNFKSALLMGDEFFVETGILKFGICTIDLSYRIVRKADNRICVDGTATYALIDLKTQRAIRIPKDVIERHTI
ncbi:MAG: acyl-CoA thioesterase [Opitutales bacterium]|nr:acyl-CoA thioesterase [Opitutales bacterium]